METDVAKIAIRPVNYGRWGWSVGSPKWNIENNKLANEYHSKGSMIWRNTPLGLVVLSYNPYYTG